MEDVKEYRFRRVAEQRTQKVLEDLRSLSKCAATESYSYSRKDAQKILDAIDKEVTALRDAFAGKKRFSLTPPPERATVDLGFATLVAEKGSDPHYKEVFIGLEDENGNWLQDLAVVGQEYNYENGDIQFLEGVSIKVFADKNNEDFTHEFSVGIYQEEKDLHRPLTEQIQTATNKTTDAHASTNSKDLERN